MASPLSRTGPLELQLAAVSGIVTPSRVPAGQRPIRPAGTFSDAGPLSTKICIVCGTAITPERIKGHFVACVHANGNPMGAQWWHNFVDAPKRQTDKSHDSNDETIVKGPEGHVCGPTPQSFANIYQNHGSNIGLPSVSTPLNQAFAILDEASTSATSNSRPSRKRTEVQRAARPSKDAARLAAVNGVFVPSKVAPGNRPNQGKLINYIPGDYDTKCNICGRGFSSPSHARSHFAICVGRNGNPYGVRWDDHFSSSNYANFPVREIHVGSAFGPASLFDMEANVSGSTLFTPQPASSDQQNLESTTDSVPRNILQDMNPLDHFDFTLRPSQDSPPAPLTMVDRERAMGVLSNAKLLDMLQSWQDLISSGQEAYAANNNGFRDVMTELEERRLIDGNWRWTISDDRIDKAYVRLVLRSKGIDQLKAVRSTHLLFPRSDPTTTSGSGGMAS